MQQPRIIIGLQLILLVYRDVSAYAVRLYAKAVFSQAARVSDLTIGDHWGAPAHHPSFDPKRGISAVLVNTERGAALFEAVRDAFTAEESELSFVAEKNSFVLEPGEGADPVPEGRDDFFRLRREKGWAVAEKTYLMDDNRKRLLAGRKKHSVRAIVKRLLRG